MSKLYHVENHKNSLNFALSYFRNGWIPIPVCNPINSKCGCGRNCEQKFIGKKPLVKYKNIQINEKLVIEWFTSFPSANIGILLKNSNLIVLDIDGQEASKEIIEKGYDLPDTPRQVTGRGEHFFFSANESTPIVRATQKGVSKKIDILSDGFILVEPSVHATGREYKWMVKPKDQLLASAPEWMLKLLQEQEEKKVTVLFTESPNFDRIDIDQLNVNDRIKETIKRFPPNNKAERDKLNIDRSRDASTVMFSLLRKGYDPKVVFYVLADPQNGISHRYYEGETNIKAIYHKIWIDIQRTTAKFQSEKGGRL